MEAQPNPKPRIDHQGELHPFDVAGPFYSIESAVMLTKKTPDEIEEAMASDQILGLPIHESDPVFPYWQFDDEGNVKGWVQDTIYLLKIGIKDPWTIAMWMNIPRENDDGEMRPTHEWVDHGGDVNFLLELAWRDGERRAH